MTLNPKKASKERLEITGWINACANRMLSSFAQGYPPHFCRCLNSMMGSYHHSCPQESVRAVFLLVMKRHAGIL
jgi:hypothetical protein